MARSCVPLTPDLVRQISAFIRAGGFPHVAAQAAGVAVEVFNDWLRRGSERHAARRYRSFRADVLQAAAQARLKAEVAVMENKPLDWLKSGPGRDQPERPGWSGPVRPHPVAPAGADIDPLTMCRMMIDFFTPHPEFRTQLAAFVAGIDKCR